MDWQPRRIPLAVCRSAGRADGSDYQGDYRKTAKQKEFAIRYSFDFSIHLAKSLGSLHSPECGDELRRGGIERDDFGLCAWLLGANHERDFGIGTP